jgi:hypothetical protein
MRSRPKASENHNQPFEVAEGAAGRFGAGDPGS